MSDPLRSVALALGDDELVIGHRHSEWTGFAPHIEEDVAFSSIAQDEIGHAHAFYSLLGEDPDAVALGRSADGYRHAVMCERPNGDWAYTLARHWLYDHADEMRLETLESSKHEALRAVAAKIRREERYHLLHADMWIKRVAAGPVEGRRRLVDALTVALGEVSGVFEPFEEEDAALAEGILAASSLELGARFFESMARRFDELGFPTHAIPRPGTEFVASSSGDLIEESETGAAGAEGPDALGGRAGRRSGDWQPLWDALTRTYREEPGATW